MAGNDVSGILDARGTLPKGLEEVPENAHDAHYCRHNKAVHHGEAEESGPVKDGSGEHGRKKTADKASPGFLGGNGGA